MAQSLVGRQIGNYKVTKQVGEGGMGAVYLGEHPMIGKKVAIKVLHDELAQKEDIVSRFFNEAKAVNDIGHENIVDVVDFGEMKDDAGNRVVYFIMEFLEGDSLNDRMKKGGVNQAQAIRIITQCASALQASHGKGIVHRDLKPDNIYLIKRGSDDLFVKLLDFGIAKLTGDGANSNKTRAGSVLGTPAYMSPEQCDGRGNIDSRSDIYSLGMVLYEMLTGRVAFTGEGFGEILVAQITLPPTPLRQHNPNVPAELEEIVLRCLIKDRNARFQTMDEFRVALENLGLGAPRPVTSLNKIIDEAPPVQSGGQQVRQPTTLSGAAGEAASPNTGPFVKPAGSKAPLWIGLAVLALGGSAGGFFVLNKKEAPPPPPLAVVAPKIEEVNVTIDSTPAGAKVQRAGMGVIGQTPLKLTLKKGETPFEVIMALDGYKNVTRAVTTDRDRDLLVAFEKEAPVAPPPVTPPPAADDKKKPSSHRPSTPGRLPGAPAADDSFEPVSDRPKSKHVDPDGVLAPSL